MTDEALLKYNIAYLGHHDLTDVITFPIESELVSGDVLMSFPRIRENAATVGVSVQDELRRVMVHGVLHLLGHDDRTLQERTAMHDLENHWLLQYVQSK